MKLSEVSGTKKLSQVSEASSPYKAGLASAGWFGGASKAGAELGDVPYVASRIGDSFAGPVELGAKIPEMLFGVQRQGLKPVTEAGQKLGDVVGVAKDALMMAMPYGNIQKAKALVTPKQGLINKAEKLVTEVLQPSKGELAEYIKRGEQLPAIRESAKVIKKAKNFEDLQSQLSGEAERLMQARSNLLKENKPIGREYIKGLVKEYKGLKAEPQTKPSDLKATKEVLMNELKFSRMNPELRKTPLTQESAEARKEMLQDITKKLLERRIPGEAPVSTEPARSRALDTLRFGLKKSIEESNPVIAELNKPYGGLLEAQDLVAGQRALAEKSIPEGPMQSVFSLLLRRPSDIPLAVARRSASSERSLPKVTAKIQKLMKEAGKYRF